MAKKLYIPVNKNGKMYKIFMDDINKVHSIAKLRRPPVPAYQCIETPKF